MNLAASDVADLQGFLLDAAKRYVVPRRNRVDDASELLSGAAALDYVLVMSSENERDPSAYAPATVASLRATLNRACGAALDFMESMPSQAHDTFEDFAGRHLGERGIFATFAALRAAGAIDDPELPFRILTLRNDLLERRARGS